MIYWTSAIVSLAGAVDFDKQDWLSWWSVIWLNINTSTEQPGHKFVNHTITSIFPVNGKAIMQICFWPRIGTLCKYSQQLKAIPDHAMRIKCVKI